MKKLILPFFSLFFSASIFAATTAGTLTVTYSTQKISSQTESFYAIYITNSSGTLINTLAYKCSNGNSSAKDYLTSWWTLIGGSSISTTTTKFVGTDGISGATTTTFDTGKTVYWGNTSVATVTDATYTVNFIIGECTSGGSSIQGNLKYSGTFDKGISNSPANSTIPASWGVKNIL